MTGNRRGADAERRIAKILGSERVPYSGAGTEKGDVRHVQYVVEVKVTAARVLGLKKDWLDKVCKQAADAGKKPVLVFRFLGDTRDWAIVPIGDVPGLVPEQDGQT